MLVAALSAPSFAAAQQAKQPCASIGPGGTISGSRCGIALARSAAPDAISRDATILVRSRHGYETAVEGKNARVRSSPFFFPEPGSPRSLLNFYMGSSTFTMRSTVG